MRSTVCRIYSDFFLRWGRQLCLLLFRRRCVFPLTVAPSLEVLAVLTAASSGPGLSQQQVLAARELLQATAMGAAAFVEAEH